MIEIPRDTKAELLELQDMLFKALADAEKLIAEGKNPTYSGQDHPLSFHVDYLKAAVSKGDVSVISQYRRGEGSWFPYHNVVESYCEALEIKTIHDAVDTLLRIGEDLEIDSSECLSARASLINFGRDAVRQVCSERLDELNPDFWIDPIDEIAVTEFISQHLKSDSVDIDLILQSGPSESDISAVKDIVNKYPDKCQNLTDAQLSQVIVHYFPIIIERSGLGLEEKLSAQSLITFLNNIPGVSSSKAELMKTYDNGPMISFEIENSAPGGTQQNGMLYFLPSTDCLTIELEKGDDMEAFSRIVSHISGQLGIKPQKQEEEDRPKFVSWDNVDASKIPQ